MTNKRKNKYIDVVILCGGLGRRLRPVIKDRPKPMAEINHKPFLDIILEHIVSYGFRRSILCIGYMSHFIKGYYKSKLNHMNILFSEEKEPLGTGGALKKAKRLIRSKTFLVLNGDSFCPIDFSKFIDFHLSKGALFSIGLTKIKQSQNCGKIKLNDKQKIISFREKGKLRNKEYCSVGIYLMEKSIFSLMSKRKSFSLEYDFFPTLVGQECYGYRTGATLIDIGTPEIYQKAQSYFRNN